MSPSHFFSANFQLTPSSQLLWRPQGMVEPRLLQWRWYMLRMKMHEMEMAQPHRGWQDAAYNYCVCKSSPKSARLTATPIPSLIFALGCYPSEQHHCKDSDCSPPFVMAIFHDRLSWRVFSLSSFVACFLASSSSSFCRAFLNPFCFAFILVE